MGLFDRIRQSDEEVEIRPPERERDVYDGFDREEDDSGAEDDDGEEEFLLPGMKPASEAESGSDRSGRDRSRDARGSSRSRDGEDVSLEKIAEQNERIIELLEEIARTGPGR